MTSLFFSFFLGYNMTISISYRFDEFTLELGLVRAWSYLTVTTGSDEYLLS